MDQRYAIIDVENVVQNICIWDGVSQWSPPPDQKAVLDTNPPTAQIGSTYDPATQTFQLDKK